MTVFVDDPDFTLHVGDALDVLAGLPDESVHCVVTSPPYWGLRDYGTGSWDGGNEDCNHQIDPRPVHTGGRAGNAYGTPPGGQQARSTTYSTVCGKCGAIRTDHQLGLEPTPDEYVSNMVNGDAIREPHTAGNLQRQLSPTNDRGDSRTFNHAPQRYLHPAGRNKRSVWEIATQPYPDAHFATFPQALVEPCVLAGTSEHGCCPECGAPWERETERLHDRESQRSDARTSAVLNGKPAHRKLGQAYQKQLDASPPQTTGWRPTCDHGQAPIPATVCDPFMGSGTTALVARRLGRRTIGIELSPEYATLAAERLQQLSLFADA